MAGASSCNTKSMPCSTLSSPHPNSPSRIALFIAVASCAYAADPLRPTFSSEVAAPERNVIIPLLKVVCREGVRTVTSKGQQAFGCGDGMEEILASRDRPRRYQIGRASCREERYV